MSKSIVQGGLWSVLGEWAKLEEVKMAFDDNKDGFVWCIGVAKSSCYFLGFKQGSEFEKCQKIIKNFDENQDERIESLNLLILLFKGNHFCWFCLFLCLRIFI